MEKAFTRQKRRTAGLLCIIVPYHHLALFSSLFPLIFTAPPKISCSFGVWLRCVCVFISLFSLRLSDGSWLSRRLGWLAWAPFFSLEQHHKSILIVLLSLCLCSSARSDGGFLRMDGEVTRMIDALSFPREGRASDSCGYDGRMNGHILIDGCDDLRHSRQSSRRINE